MMLVRNRFLLWFGAKHSGKTTTAAKLAQRACAEGFTVAGLLAPSIYLNGELIGFDTLDLRNKTRAHLADRKTNGNKTERFAFTADGLKLGSAALSPASTKSAELIIVDEFGPLEIHGSGWRKNVDSLFSSSNATMLLVVRREVAEQVRQLYANVPSRKLSASKPESIDKVLTILRSHRGC
jgi:nucleoside-triphosphatase THEP1